MVKICTNVPYNTADKFGSRCLRNSLPNSSVQTTRNTRNFNPNPTNIQLIRLANLVFLKKAEHRTCPNNNIRNAEHTKKAEHTQTTRRVCAETSSRTGNLRLLHRPFTAEARARNGLEHRITNRFLPSYHTRALKTTKFCRQNRQWHVKLGQNLHWVSRNFKYFSSKIRCGQFLNLATPRNTHTLFQSKRVQHKPLKIT